MLDRPQNKAILKFMQGRDWVTAEDIAGFLSMNVTMAMLYISDLEKVNLVTRKQEGTKEKKTVKFKLSGPSTKNLEDILKSNGSEISQEKVIKAIRVYIGIYNSMIHKLNEIGGRSTLENIVDRGTEEMSNNKAKQIVIFLEKGGDLDGALEAFNKGLPSGGFTAANFSVMKGDFVTVLKSMIDSLEKFMGRLYGQHLARSSLKNVISENKDIIHELDLFAGLPKEYFPVGGT